MACWALKKEMGSGLMITIGTVCGQWTQKEGIKLRKKHKSQKLI
jgi:hypothetical protein